MKKSRSGLIAILANYNTREMRKVLDLKITSGYPTVTIPTDFKIHIPEQQVTTSGYQHITIPPDLNVHITGANKPKIWAPKMQNLIMIDGKLSVKFQKILTAVFSPISDFPVFVDRSYQGAEIIGFSQLPHWNDNTSFVLELFVLQNASVRIPDERHCPGEKGAYMPWKYPDLGKTFSEPHKQGKFWIRQFAITNHDPKAHKTITVRFWDSK